METAGICRKIPALSGQVTSGLVTSAHFRSPPVRSHDGRSGSLLLAFPFLPSRLLLGPGGSGLVRWVGTGPEVTALLSVCPQQEGLDDGPDFLSEEERGVSVRAGASGLFVSARLASPRLTNPAAN